jgi:hypothetical protein
VIVSARDASGAEAAGPVTEDFRLYAVPPASSAPLVVGVPREVKTDEHRVAITPDGVLEMTHRDVPVVIEEGAPAPTPASATTTTAAPARRS